MHTTAVTIEVKLSLLANPRNLEWAGSDPTVRQRNKGRPSSRTLGNGYCHGDRRLAVRVVFFTRTETLAFWRTLERGVHFFCIKNRSLGDKEEVANS